MKGAFPPNSSDSFLIVGAHCAINNVPTLVEPLKDSLRTVVLWMSAAPISVGMPVTTLITPAGMPACTANDASASAVKGVSSEGLITTAHPAASAGAILQVIIAAGKFHGVMMAQTPTGSFKVTIRLSGQGEGTVRPASSNDISGTEPTVTPFAGLVTEMRLPEALSHHSPPIRLCSRKSLVCLIHQERIACVIPYRAFKTGLSKPYW